MEPNDIGNFQFGDGRWTCNDAGLPPKIQNSETYMWEDRGYIIFPKDSCSGGAFEQQCFCWNEFKRLKGEDPLISQTVCESTCTHGGCDNFPKCGKSPPGPLPPQPAAPILDPLEAENQRSTDLKMDTGTMDPVPRE